MNLTKKKQILFSARSGPMSAPAMDDADDDMLIDLLSYECPFTGKKRTAGMMTPDQIEPEKRAKFLAVESL